MARNASLFSSAYFSVRCLTVGIPNSTMRTYRESRSTNGVASGGVSGIESMTSTGLPSILRVYSSAVPKDSASPCASSSSMMAA